MSLPPSYPSSSWYVSKRAILSSLALIYFVAFYGAYNQNLGLMGRNGLLVDHRPYQHFASYIEKYYYNNSRGNDKNWWWLLQACHDHPSLFWFVVTWYDYFEAADDIDHSDVLTNPNFVADYVMTDQNLMIVFKSGMTLSCLVLFNIIFGTTTTAATTANGGGGGGATKNYNNNTVHTDNHDDPSSMAIQFMLWLLYFTVVSSCDATSFYSYGWESQLLETGFLSIFLCESVVFPSTTTTVTNGFGFGWFWKNSDPSRHKLQPQKREDEIEQHHQQQQQSTPATNILVLPQPRSEILWLFRWLSFRISIGAGLIKIRGDSCWTDKTCLWYHFETQPIPSPMSFIFHFLPKWMLSHAVDLDLFVQVYTSWFVLIPTSIPGMSSHSVDWFLLNVVRIGGLIQIGFMINIILSGNFAFLNHLTIVPSLACLDDACWPKCFLPRVKTRQLQNDPTSSLPGMASSSSQTDRRDGHANRLWNMIRPRRRILNWLVFGLIMMLSRPVVENLLQIGGKRQQMNASFDSFRLVGSYGAFGSVGKARYEPIVQIAFEMIRTNSTPTYEWIELEFPCKPGSLTRRPCFCAPYHYRLDWNIWFIGFKPHIRYLHQRESWLFDLLAKILQGLPAKETNDDQTLLPWLDLLDRSSASMLRENYVNGRTPAMAKVDMYHYKMAAPLWEIVKEYADAWFSLHKSSGSNVVWWKRKFEESLIPVVKFDPVQKRLVAIKDHNL